MGSRVSAWRRGRPAAAGATGGPTDEVLHTADDVAAVLRALPARSPELRLRVASLDLVRVLTLADPGLEVEGLVLTVEHWIRPVDDWSGRIGHVTGLASCSVAFPPEKAGVARAEIRTSRPTPLADLARAAYPLFGVDRGLHGYGLVQLGTADAPATSLALLPSRTAPGIPAIPSVHLEGRGLSRADLGLVGTHQTLEELRATAEDPELTSVSHPLLTHASGHLEVSDRLHLPLVDLNVHHPVGRLYQFRAALTRMRLLHQRGELVVDRVGKGRLESWSHPAAAPFTGEHVARLRPIEEIDLSSLEAPASRDEELLLYRRLAEIAATGVILHGLPSSFALAEEILGEKLADLLRAPYRPSVGLQRELRTVPQRREAMERFGGFFELAAHAEQLGHRLLPTVSVVLATMRPSRVAAVLTALAAQHYPHVEIAVALHGADEAAGGPEFEEAVRASGAAVHLFDQSMPFGSVLAELARRTSGDLVVKIDDDDFYGPRVIGDLVLAHLYSNADVVGKTTEYLYFEDIDHTAHRRFLTEAYHTQVAGGTLLLSRGALNDVGGWRPTRHSTDRSVLIRVGNSGGVCYRTQSLGYVYVRHSDGHTWRQEDSQLLKNAPEQWPRFMPEIVDT